LDVTEKFDLIAKAPTEEYYKMIATEPKRTTNYLIFDKRKARRNYKLTHQ